LRIVSGVRRIRAARNLFRIADAVSIRIHSRSAAVAACIEDISIAVAGTGRNFRTAAGVNGSRTVANSARIEGTHAGVLVVANTIVVCIRRACAAADPESIELISVAIAIAGWDA
jgi:hypothetical protein